MKKIKQSNRTEKCWVATFPKGRLIWSFKTESRTGGFTVFLFTFPAITLSTYTMNIFE